MIANMRYKLGATVAYFLVLVWFAYHDGSPVPDWIGYSVVFVLPFVLGFGAGLWPALALPPAVLLAIPAGYGSGELPVWFGMALMGAAVALPGILLGWVAGWLARRYLARRQEPRRRSQGLEANT